MYRPYTRKLKLAFTQICIAGVTIKYAKFSMSTNLLQYVTVLSRDLSILGGGAGAGGGGGYQLIQLTTSHTHTGPIYLTHLFIYNYEKIYRILKKIIIIYNNF
jgi:hypothetical protein